MQKTSKDSTTRELEWRRAIENDLRNASPQLKEELTRSTMLSLLGANFRLKRQLNFWAGICLALAALILLTLLFRSI